MKRNFKFAVLALLFSAASCSFTTKDFNNPDKDKLLIDLISYVLERGHYDAKDLDDNFSQAVFEDYIDALDPFKRYFYQKDIEEFAEYKNDIDDMIREKNLAFFDLTYTRLRERIKEAEGLQAEVIKSPFDFSIQENTNTDYDQLDYVKNKKALKNRWRIQLKLQVLGAYYDAKEDQEDNGDEVDEIMSDEELEANARQEIADNLTDYFEFSNELERKDYFSTFLNAVVEEFDPHTYYFAPVAKDRFDTQISGQFQGIGARLQKRRGDILVTEVISGGPAWRQDAIQEGDVILKVSQEDQEEPTSVVGMRLDDAVKLIKGPKGTQVTLSIKSKLDGAKKDVVITRDIVELEEVYARSAYVDKEDNRYGLINLPKFYFNIDDYGERNAATDVKKEIERLKMEGIDGLVIDLRNNGGGSLKTVVDIAGLFIKEGPVVQVKSNGDNPEILEDKDAAVDWDGPLVILVNEISASASEILAAAMQDYKRAIVIGSKQTYGKGTVQNIVDLNRWVRKNDFGDLGALKITTQKFYRVNGGSTQLEGVKSDVVVPDRFSYIDVGEKDQENPLPWDKIRAADYTIWDGYIDFEQTIQNSRGRMAQNAQLQLIDSYAQWLKERRDDNEWPLDYDSYKERIVHNEQEAERFDALDDYDSQLSYNSLPYEEALFENDSILKEKRKRWHKNLAQDVYMEEALNVLQDLKINNIRKNNVAVIKD